MRKTHPELAQKLYLFSFILFYADFQFNQNDKIELVLFYTVKCILLCLNHSAKKLLTPSLRQPTV